MVIAPVYWANIGIVDPQQNIWRITLGIPKQDKAAVLARQDDKERLEAHVHKYLRHIIPDIGSYELLTVQPYNVNQRCASTMKKREGFASRRGSSCSKVSC